MYMIVSAIIPPISFINTSNPWLAHSVYLIHPIDKILPPIYLLKSSYCFFPPFRVYFHQWLLSLCFWVSVDYATGEPLFPISTIFSITSSSFLPDEEKQAATEYRGLFLLDRDIVEDAE